MFMQVQKRSGQVVFFKQEKIIVAITKAGKTTREFDENKAKELTKKVIENLKKVTINIPKVEQIQDMVEDVLLKSKYKKTAKAYILYRDQHRKIRDITNAMNNDLIDDYLTKRDWQVKENANMSFSLQGLRNYIASEVSKNYWLDKIYLKEISQAHNSGDIHIHDLDSISTYCVGWDLQDLLREGFKGVSGKIESKPAKHFKTALGQLVNFFYTLQHESAGAQAVSNFDTLLAPFIYYDKLNYSEVKQALQEFIFNINVPTRVGCQTPFTNVTMDLICPEILKYMPVIIGGENKNKTYKDFQKEMNIFNKAFVEVITAGDAKGRVFTFPIPTYNITKDFDWENKDLDPIWKMTAKYGIPYFSNFVNSDMNPEDARSMCCRLRLDNRKLRKRGGGLFGANPLTGSIGVVTVNLPRLAYLAKNEKIFLRNLKNKMNLAKDSLEIKRKILEQFTDQGLYPYSKFYLRNIKKHDHKYWNNHFSTIGLIGMNEACLNLIDTDITTQKGQEFTNKVLDFMRDIIINYQKETGNEYNLEATPGEGTSYRLALKDKNKYPEIIVANQEKKLQKVSTPFYTNSSQLPVNFTDDIFELLDLQDNIQTKYTGGTVIHLFIGEEITDIDAVKNLIRKICGKYRLPYFTITPTFSICPNHGYIAGQVEICPKCGKKNEIWSRIVGYMRPISQWHDGKLAEFNIRKNQKVV